MFWNNFYQLCLNKNTKPNPVAKELGIASSTISQWKNDGMLPNANTLIKLADYFNVSVDYLLGREDKREFDPQNLVCKPDAYVIAYLDLLGTTEFLEQNKNFNMYETLYRKYKDISSSYNSGRKIKKIEFKVFSDNLIFAIKLGNYSSYSDEFQYKLQTLFFIVKSFQLEFLHDYGILLRGGITIGELFIDDIFVLGDGLVKAYNLENNVANFPRVVVDDSILNRIDFVKQISPLIQTLLAKDKNDDLTYINFLCDISSSDYLKTIFETISNKIDTYKNDDRKLKNWLWLQEYNNSENANSYGEIAAWGAEGTKGTYYPPEEETT